MVIIDDLRRIMSAIKEVKITYLYLASDKMFMEEVLKQMKVKSHEVSHEHEISKEDQLLLLRQFEEFGDITKELNYISSES